MLKYISHNIYEIIFGIIDSTKKVGLRKMNVYFMHMVNP